MKKTILFVSIMIVVTFIFFVPFIEQFTISNAKTNNIVYYDCVDKFENFYISFIHSVNRTPVNEYYKIKGNKFVVYKTTFYSFGAGMPDGSELPNANMKLSDGFVEIDDINREINEFTYFVGTYAGHTLNAKNEKFKLEKYVEPQEPALFKIKRVSIYDILRRRFNE